MGFPPRRSARLAGLLAVLLAAGPVRAEPEPLAAGSLFLKLKPEARLEHREAEGCWVGTGGIVLRKGGATLTADRIVYWEGEASAYAEGFVVFEDAERRIFAERIYFSFSSRKGRLEKGRIIRHDPDRGIHYYLQGDTVEIDGKRTVLHNVTITTCSFATPHVAWHADRMTLTEDGPGLGSLVSENNSLKIGEWAIAWLPHWSRDLGKTHFPLRSAQGGQESNLGYFLRSKWDLTFWPVGDFFMNVDYFSKHGFGGGPEMAWDPGDGGEGRALAYGIRDTGDDPGGAPPETDGRYRLHFVDHRFYPDGWSTILEASRLSDPNMLPLYFEREARTGKEQETRAYVQHVEGDYAASALLRPRTNDFQTQVEYLPKADFRILSKSFLDGRLLWRSTTEFAEAALRPSDLGEGVDQSTARLDTLHEVAMPFPLGPVHAQAFVDERMTWYSETKESDIDKVRVISGGGARFGTQFLKPLAATSEFWNIRAMRHIVVPQVEYRTSYDSTIRNDRLMAIDAVDSADRFERLTLSLNNILQAKRRPASRQETDLPKAEAPPLVTADFATLFLRVHHFPVPHRDNEDKPFSPVEGRFRILPRDYVAFYTDWTQIRSGAETWNAGITINPDYAEAFGSDRFGRSRFSARALETDSSGAKVASSGFPWSLNVENRYVRGESSTTNGTVTYVFSERWSAAFSQEYEWNPGHRGDQRIVFRRDMHEWTAELSVSTDKNHGSSVFFLIYPKGI